MISRPPIAALQPFVQRIWATRRGEDLPVARREFVLPTGFVHLSLRLEGPGLRIYADEASGEPVDLGRAVVGGPRTRHYVRDVSEPVESVGALLHAGAAPLLFGVPADALAERHTPLEQLWGRFTREAISRLSEATTSAARLEVLEALLLERLTAGAAPPAVIAFATRALEGGMDVASVVARSGYSHRHFIALFKAAVGLTPKAFARVRRFGSALNRLAADPVREVADIAWSGGFSDQAHFTREFRAFTGLSPCQYRRVRPAQIHHVPVRSDSFKTPRRDGGTVDPPTRSRA